jgi:hypothetical protein
MDKNTNRRQFLKALSSILAVVGLIGCKSSGNGGGGVSKQPISIPTPNKPLRSDLLFGYYGDWDNIIPETADHVNYVWLWGWSPNPKEWNSIILERMKEANAAGVDNVILGLWTAFDVDAEVKLKQTLDMLDSHGLLGMIVAFYPVDEPNGDGNRTAEELKRGCAAIRRVVSNYPALRDRAKLAVIYAGESPDYRAIEEFDWIGFDDYDKGTSVLGAAYDRLKARLRPDQKGMLVVGGASPWREDPAPFFWAAQNDPQIVAIVSFIWFDNWDQDGKPGGKLGIKSNGMAPLYRCYGKMVKNPTLGIKSCP